MIRPIPRRGPMSAATFHREHVVPRRPVVLEGLLDGPYGAIRTVEAAVDRLGPLPVRVRDMSGSSYAVVQQGAACPTWTMAALLHRYESEPANPWLCVNQPVWPEVLAGLPVPSVVGDERDLHTQLFVGTSLRVAHTHFDGDYRERLLCHLFGRKRVALIEPPLGAPLLPLRTMAGVALERLDDDAREALLDLVDAWTGELAPGDVLFMPAAVWHHVDYLDTAGSFSVGFGRGPVRAWLQRHLHRDRSTQMLAWALSDADLPPFSAEVLRQLAAGLAAPAASPLERSRRMHDLCRALCDRYVPQPIPREWAWTGDERITEESVRFAVERDGLYGDAVSAEAR